LSDLLAKPETDSESDHPDTKRPHPVIMNQLPLAPEPQFLDQVPVALQVTTSQVGQETTTPSDELQETASAMVILGVLLKVLGELFDPRREQRDLDGGGSAVVLVLAEFLYDAGRIRVSRRHVSLSPSSLAVFPKMQSPKIYRDRAVL
jgi:hypothetical protein